MQARLGSSADAGESVPAALYSALAHDRFEAALRFAVRLGGDTDTVAAMAGALAGARDGSRAIPTRWVEALEDGDRGRSHVRMLVTPLCRVHSKYEQSRGRGSASLIAELISNSVLVRNKTQC